MSEIKQPNKNWVNDHNFNKDLTFKIMKKKQNKKKQKYRKTNVPFNCLQVSLAVTHRVVLVDTYCLVESSSSSHRLVESSSSSQLH